MAQSVHGKRKLNCKSIVEKCKILQQLEQGTSGEIARTNGIIKQTLCTWIKDVKVIYATFKDNKTSARRQTLRKFSFGDRACLEPWLVFPQHKNIQSSGNILNPLSADPTKWSNTPKQFVGRLPTNCLSVFDHVVKLVLNGLK